MEYFHLQLGRWSFCHSLCTVPSSLFRFRQNLRQNMFSINFPQWKKYELRVIGTWFGLSRSEWGLCREGVISGLYGHRCYIRSHRDKPLPEDGTESSTDTSPQPLLKHFLSLGKGGSHGESRDPLNSYTHLSTYLTVSLFRMHQQYSSAVTLSIFL